ncbi:non-ribosomal peptide synthetase [Chitinophaga nivalis]|uniref:Amino acid adenylation domain-containing protein n=1 Tax=Chitinophaga nivalis TaxID=2991709 RepID=A0ABT3IPB1_9BACT|nr:non-ribosomal peptide synthetase [Chitinophaga nivalis]MCW3464493.1 amino acid adenylation domain-containing protein [Chitinophaga nivalis]MCW3485816.1 amino acid adenylation domain-containing protein [Chitinophaga nivalis]
MSITTHIPWTFNDQKVPLTPYQAMLYQKYLQDIHRDDYHVIWDQLLSGDIDIVWFNQRLIKFVNDHVFVNSNVTEERDQYFWIQRAPIPDTAQLLQCYADPLSPEDILQLTLKRFDLKKDLLIRLYLLKQDSNNYRFICTIPHILIDGMAENQFIYEISRYYSDIQYNKETAVQHQVLQQYQLWDKLNAAWQEGRSEMSDFWTKHLNNLPAVNTDFLKTNAHVVKSPLLLEPFKTAEIRFSYDETVLADVLKVAVKYELDHAAYAELILAILLHQTNQQQDIAIGNPIDILESDSLQYHTHNNYIIRDYRFNEATTLRGVISQYSTYQQEFKQANAGCIPIREVLQYVGNKDLLTVVFAQANLNEMLLSYKGLANVDINSQLNRYVPGRLIFEQEIREGRIDFRISYNSREFNSARMNNFINVYRHLFTKVLEDLLNDGAGNAVHSYELLQAPDYTRIFDEWNATQKEFPEDQTIHSMFEEQVRRTPENIALVYEDLQFTYRELNNRANQLADYLKASYDIQPDDLIVLCLDRSEHMLVSVLAILKSGAAYVPVDPGYPDDRIDYIIADTQTKVVLTSSRYAARLSGLSGTVPVESVDKPILLSGIITDFSTENQTDSSQPENLAYVIYTSGTTGRPKGVMVEHKGIINRIVWMNNEYPLVPSDRILQKTPYVFDVSVWELFWANWYGAAIVIAPPDVHRDSVALAKLIDTAGVTVLHFVPSMLSAFEGVLENEEYLQQGLSSLRYIFCSGEALLLKQVTKSHELIPSAEIHNLYGPTEASVDILYYDCNARDIDKVAIGYPISNIRVYILDGNLSAVPVGAEGELYAAGVGLARGYLHLPGLTAERFIPNPFQTEEERQLGIYDRLYKTGDLVKYQRDGAIDYLGRNDFQVKIRGFRIELGEIENRLADYPDVTQAVVVAKGEGADKFLAGYYVAPAPLDQQVILDHMGLHLPEYMLPAILIHLYEMPLTTNGKLDRKALPEAVFINTDDYHAPENEIHTQLCQIYAELLELEPEKISIHSSFFRLGGNSIMGTQLVSRVRRQLGVEITIMDVFKHKTVAALYSELIAQNDTIAAVQAEQGVLTGTLPLLPFHTSVLNKITTGGDLSGYTYIGIVPPADQELLTLSVQQLFAWHDALRIHAVSDSNTWQLIYQDTADHTSLTYITGDEGTLQHWLTGQLQDAAASSFPLARVVYLKGATPENDRLYFLLHALIADVASGHILIKDLERIYLYLAANREDAATVQAATILGNKGGSYRQWLNELSVTLTHEQDGAAAEQIYWEKVLTAIPASNASLGVVRDSSLHHEEFVLDQYYTGLLSGTGNKVYNTRTQELILGALSMLLRSWTGHQEHYVLLQDQLRETLPTALDFSRTIGALTPGYPVSISCGDDPAATIVEIKESIRNVPGHGSRFVAVGGVGEKELPNIRFTYLGEFETAAEAPITVWRGADDLTWDVSQDAQYILSIAALIIGGQLHVRLLGHLATGELSQLFTGFQHHLKVVIDYLHDQSRTYLTPADVGGIVSKDYLNRLQAAQELDGVYLANSLHQGFIYHALSQGDVDDAYCVQIVWEYNALPDVLNLEGAWKAAQARFSTMRLRFAWEEELLQIVDKQGTLDWRYSDLTHVSPEEQETILNKLQADDRTEQYDLAKAGLFRLYLIKIGDTHYRCIFSHHHAILDGWSIPVLFNYVHDTYEQLRKGWPVNTSVDSSYEAAQVYLQHHWGDNKIFWKDYVALLTEKEDLTGLLLPEKRKTILSEYRHVAVPAKQVRYVKDEKYAILKALCYKYDLTPNAVIQYFWHKQLRIYGGVDTTVVGMTVSGRNIPIDDAETAVGLFINTLPVILEHKGGLVWKEITTLQAYINEVNSRGEMNLSKLQKNGERLFCCLYDYENFPVPRVESEVELQIEFREMVEKLDYPLGFMAFERGGEIKMTLHYAGELFSEEQMNEMVGGVVHLLDQWLENPSLESHALNYVNDVQYQQLIRQWNDTTVNHPQQATVPAFFEQQVNRTPDNIALVSGESVLTYRTLNEKANQLAAYLRATYHIQPDDLIALCLDRSEYMLIAILAVMKAGAAYVPLDPAYPDERITYIWEDTQAKVLLTHAIHQPRLTALNAASAVAAIDADDFNSLVGTYPATNIPLESSHTHNLAYVIYTSGTTGKPKGVLVEHKSVVNLIHELITVHRLDRYEHIGIYSSYVFDAFVCEAFPVFCNGNTMYLYSEQLRTSVDDLRAYIQQKNIAVSVIPSALLPQFLEQPVPALKTIITGGERLPDIVPGTLLAELVNEYGPTEATVCTSYHCYEPGGHQSSIGRPIGNITCYVLGKDLQVLPVGATGELYVGGSGVTRGYLHLPELTAEKFIANPFRSAEETTTGLNGRLYKTGDLVRYLPDGTMEFVGRTDFQVKIRGYRIELGEIESKLTTHPAIKQVVVLTREQGGAKFLVAYYIAEQVLPHPDLLAYAASVLPAYMVPAVFVYLEQLPLTRNGKLDRQALPVPELETATDGYQAPLNETEALLCNIYAELLDLKAGTVGTGSDFFRLGGDSIVSIRLVSRIRQHLRVEITVKDVFKYRTIAALYNHIVQKQAAGAVAAQTEQDILTGTVNWSPVQQWYLADNDLQGRQLLYIAVPELDHSLLEQSLQKLIAYHDVLRLAYKKDKNGYEQYYAAADATGDWHIHTLNDVELSGKNNGVWEAADRLFNITYVAAESPADAYLQVAAYPLLLDIPSWKIIVRDWQRIYSYLSAQPGNTTDIHVHNILGAKGSSYRQWVNAVGSYLVKEEYQSGQRDHWHAVTAAATAGNQQLEAIATTTVLHTRIQLDARYSKLLLDENNKIYRTATEELLLSGLYLSLSALTGSVQHQVLLAGDGRALEAGTLQSSHTTGLYTTIYPVELSTDKQDFATVIVAVKEALRKVPDQGIGFGAILPHAGDTLPHISFQYLGQFNNRTAEEASWQLTGEGAGWSLLPVNNDQHVIHINAIAVDGILQLNITGRLSAADLQQFATGFRQQLEAIADYLSTQERGYLTAADVKYIVSAEHLTALQADREITGIYLANSLQQGFIYHALNQGDIDSAYRVQHTWDYNNPLQVDLLEQAWQKAQQRYSTLRLRFAWEEALVQIIDKTGALDWRYSNIDHLSKEEQEQTIEQILTADQAIGYDLAAGNLFRIYLIRFSAEQYRCIFSNHHAILDGWSMPVLMNYVHTVYLQLLAGEQPEEITTDNYAATQLYLQQSGVNHTEYWNGCLEGLTDREDLSGLLKPGKRQVQLPDYRHIIAPASEELVINATRYTALKAFCSQHGLTLNAVLQYLWHKQLSVYGGVATTVVGMTVAGRNLAIDGIEEAVGLYINTLPVVLKHEEEQVLTSISRLQDQINEVNSHSNIDLSKLQKGGERLFSSLFVYENYPEPASIGEGQLHIEFKQGIGKLDYSLAVVVYEFPGEVALRLEYAGELFSSGQISQLLTGMITLLDQLIAQPAITSQEIRYVDQAQYNQLVHDWNATASAYPDQATIPELFEQQVLLTPHHTALVYEGGSLTYEELNIAANRLAAYLKATYDIVPDDLIGLCVDRSPDMIIATLAILKSGAAYVPVDPEYPIARIAFVMADVKPRVILTNERNVLRLQSCSDAAIEVLDSSSFRETLVTTCSPSNLTTATQADSLAYVIYTSGTTGQPKGVMIAHQGVNRLVKNINYLTITAQDVLLQLSTVSFDAATFEIWGALLNGAKLVLVAEIMDIAADPGKFRQLLTTHEVSILFLTKALLDSFYLADDHIFDGVNILLTGGEALNKKLIEKITTQPEGPKYVFNCYGPTENSAYSTTYLCLEEAHLDLSTVPIGRPIANSTAYILSAAHQLLPVGAIGELYVGGDGVARGYLRQPELTAARFIPNPFQTAEEKATGSNSRLYKSGDLVRFLPDGNLEFVGRNDQQVKVRGYRIELEEIESKLITFAGIKQALVLARTQGAGKYLVGYYVADNALEHQEILQHLKEQLPDYMVPSALVYLEQLPVTINGKLDRTALPDPELLDNDTYQAPANETEASLCGIYGELLGLDPAKISTHDDFFRLGGDSIVSIQLVSRLRQRLGIQVSVRDIFKHRTIASLYSQVIASGTTSQKVLETEQGVLTGSADLLPVQSWFFNKLSRGLLPEYNHWNQSFLVVVPALDIELLHAAVTLLINYHDVLRFTYQQTGAGYQQHYEAAVPPFHIHQLDIRSLLDREELDTVLTEWQRGFDIFGTRLWQIGYISGYADGSSRLYFALHHLLIDAVSWRILSEDLQRIYTHLSAPENPPASAAQILGAKGSSYRQWTAAIKGYLSADEARFAAEKSRWEQVTTGIAAYNTLLASLADDTIKEVSFSLDAATTAFLLRDSHRVYHTEINDLLLSALSQTLSSLTGSDRHYVLLEGHGREEVFPGLDVTHTVGWFTTMYPVMLPSYRHDTGKVITAVKESLRSIPNKGIGYGALLGYVDQVLPEISFNYLGQLDNTGTDIAHNWHISGERSGTAMSEANNFHSVLSINGMVTNGQLHLYLSGRLSSVVLDVLSSNYRQSLEDMLDYLRRQERSYLTVSDVDQVVSAAYLQTLQSTREITGVYLANSLQEGFIYHALNQGEVDDAYRVQLIWDYQVALQEPLLRQAWLYAQQQYSSLRLRFSWEESLIQVIDKTGILNWQYVDLSAVTADAQAGAIAEILSTDRARVYDLTAGNLFRVYLLRLSATHYRCILSNHHAILDGWSMTVLLDYIHSTYLRLQEGHSIAVHPDESYAAAQAYLQSHRQDHRAYWTEYISRLGDRENLSGLLQIDKRQVELSEYRHILSPAEHTLYITDARYAGLKALSREQGVTVNAVLQYLWHKQLSVYGGTATTVVGMTVSGRNLAIDHIEESVGLYINTLPVILEHKDEDILATIRHLQDQINEMSGRSDISLSGLQQGERLFNSLFVYENYPESKGGAGDALGLALIEGIEKLDYPLAVTAYEKDGRIVLWLRYAGELFDAASIAALLNGIGTLLDQLISQPAITSRELRYVDQAQYHQLVHDWNATATAYPDQATIPELFEQQVLLTPDNIALVFEGGSLTYHELNMQANRLAAYLKATYEIVPDDLIALCVDRSPYMIIATLAILKSGAAYVPVDPEYPIARIAFVMADVKPRVVLTNDRNVGRLQSCSDAAIEVIDSSTFQETLTTTYPPLNLNTAAQADNLAYVIYTSGTTGQPKGVMVAHRSVNRLVSNTNYQAITAQDVFLQLSPVSFDAATFEIWGALLNGAKLVLVAEILDMAADPGKFRQLLTTHHVSILWLTKTLFDSFYLADEHIFDGLSNLLVGGEVLNKRLIEKITLQSHGPKHVYNCYGPTENTTFSTTYQCLEEAHLDLHTLPIGRPIANSTAYVLSATQQLLPVGAIGELYVGGAGVARGYLRQPELTAARFIPNPFRTAEEIAAGRNGRLYKSGDLVRYLPDGNIEFVGRNDHQVKVRGYRIELEEIESKLIAFAGVKQAVVLARTQGAGKYLVGYYVADSVLDHQEILQCLNEQLPDYMVPSALVHLEQLPATINGKLDRAALPDPQLLDKDTYQAPVNETEASLCNIYGELLGLDPAKISTHDDFFRMGGDSIVSIQLVSRLRQRLGIQVSVRDIFKHRTIASLYSQVIAKSTSGRQVLQTEQGVLTGLSDLLPVQSWFFDKLSRGLLPEYNHWNQSFLVVVPALDINLLHTAIELLISYHDALRFTYQQTAAGYEQQYAATVAPFNIHELDIRSLPAHVELASVLTEWQRDFDIFGTRLWQIGYLSGYADGSSRLYFAWHHLLIDVVSWRILSEDLQRIYTYLSTQENPPASAEQILGAKGSSYRQWTTAIKGYLSADETALAAEKARWEQVTTGIAAYNAQLATLTDNTVKEISFSLDTAATAFLLRDSHQVYHTAINDLLLSGLSLALSSLTGNEQHYVLLEGHGREEIFPGLDITHTVGWFTTLYPVLLPSNGQHTGEVITAVKESLRSIPNKGIGYGALLGYVAQVLPEISFNYLGQLDNTGTDAVNHWHISGEWSGTAMSDANEDHNILTVNSMVTNGQLHVYLSGRLSADVLEAVNNQYRQSLADILQYLQQQERSYLTVSDVDHIVSAAYLHELQATREIAGVYLANSLQEGFIYHALNQGDVDDAYRVQLVWDYKSALQAPLLRQAWLYAQEKYSSLRLRFSWEESLVQVIDKTGELHWQYEDLSGATTDAQDYAVAEILSTDRSKAYDLSAGNLFRVYLLRLSATHYRCILSNHHAILDGWSMPVLLDYIHSTYLRLQDGYSIAVRLDESYATAQTYLQSHRQHHRDYWTEYVGRLTDREDLSGLLRTDKRHVELSAYRHVLLPFEHTLLITGARYTGLKALSAQYGLTVNAVLQYLWHKQLSLYGGTTTTVVGMTVSGRNLAIDDIEESVGLYINTLPVILEHEDVDILVTIRNLQDQINEVSTRSDISLAGLQHGERLFNSLFVYENYPDPKGAAGDTLGIEFKEGIEKLDYPLAVTAYEKSGEIVVKLEYAGDLFDADKISQILTGIGTLLDQLISRPDITNREIRYLDQPQYNQLIAEWNATTQPYQHDRTLQEVFEEQVKKTPDHIAVAHGEIALTYRELNTRANQLASYLKTVYQVQPDELITLCLRRSVDMVVAILAVWKAGGAYVPIDPEAPDERIAYILADTQAKVILTNAAAETRLTQLSQTAAVTVIDDARLVLPDAQTVSDQPQVNTPQHLAYVIYTSGTTGKPKGVMVPHQGVVNLIQDIHVRYGFGADEVVLQLANYVFDSSIEQILLALLHGHKLLLVDNHSWENESAFLQTLISQQVTYIDATPSLLEILPVTAVSTLRRISSGGEHLTAALLHKIRSAHYRIINSYGPTEATVTVAANLNAYTTGIGRPFANTTLYVLDKYLVPVPVGAAGELYIGGDGVARGYLNLPELTSKSFIANPFQSEEEKANGFNGRLYKTGDLVRYLPDGNLEFLGRNDFQLKIRGYRVEPGEIEAQLQRYPGVKRAVIVLKQLPSGAKYLVGYYVAAEPLNHQQLLTWLGDYLPEYMVPATLVYLEKLPLTANGKLNHPALPVPVFSDDIPYQAPENETEEVLRDIYAEILGLQQQQVGINDDFFRLGGNSILAIRVVRQISHRLHTEVRLATLLMSKSIKGLATLIRKGDSKGQLITKLNTAVDKEPIFMIHPAAGGSEVYTSLAEKLSDDFSCYGIEPYNLYHQEKINDLQTLAAHYLDLIDQVPATDTTKGYRLLGWSLGGQIALEMAALLESRGVTDIRVYLLDTVLREEDTDLQQLFKKAAASSNGIIRDKPQMENIYVQEELNTLEDQLSEQAISQRLSAAKIILLKAMLVDERYQQEDILALYQGILQLPFNNIDRVAAADQIRVIPVQDKHHGNILEEEAAIYAAILEEE